MRFSLRSRGLSLIELLLSVAILSGIMITVAAIVQRLAHAQVHRDVERTAERLAQDKIETLKLHRFANLALTSKDDATDTGCASDDAAFDRNPDQYPAEILHRHSAVFQRQTCIEMVRPSTENGAYIPQPSYPSTGLKRVVVRVRWPVPLLTSEETAEAIFQDAEGPQQVNASSGTFSVKVRCTAGTLDAKPCRGTSFYLFGPAGEFLDSAISDRDGQAKFLTAPTGSVVIEPQLDPGDSADPTQMTASLPIPEHSTQDFLFVVTRPQAHLHLTTNREDTLVVVAPGLAADAPKEISLVDKTDPGVYGLIFSDPSNLELLPGTYSLRCFSSGVDGRSIAFDPLGATNASWAAGENYELACHFPN